MKYPRLKAIHDTLKHGYVKLDEKKVPAKVHRDGKRNALRLDLNVMRET